MTFNKLIQQLKGGAGSGNFGHSGRTGKRGGSAPGGGKGSGGGDILTKSPNNYAIAEALGVKNVKGGVGTIQGNAVSRLRKTLEANGYRE